MRRFVITNPNLSAGRPGEIVDASQLNMGDDKLDDFVDAGFAAEIFDGGDSFPYEPDDHTVPEVLAHIADNPADAIRVISYEVQGRNRSGIVNAEIDR